MDHISARKMLQDSLVRRSSTGAVAAAILGLGVANHVPALHAELQRLGSQHARYVRYSYQMNDDFDKVDAADTQLAALQVLFPQADVSTVTVDVYAQGYVQQLQDVLRKALHDLAVPASWSASDALRQRLELDWDASFVDSKKAFMKRLRFLKNFEDKIARVQDSLTVRHAQMQAKSRLAYAVDASKMDDVSLAFVAYLAARANRRSLFMLGGQSKAKDVIVEGLKALLDDTSAWEQIALVSPTVDVFNRLDKETVGQLSGVFHRHMVVAADRLDALFVTLPQRMRDEMVMVKGVDSSSWNAFAGALNTMRSAWLAATVASGLDSVLDVYLPGKAPRLMAADVVWWARNSGQELHIDTRLFATLPRPWDVISGKESLTRKEILAKAKAFGVDNVLETGWIGPRVAVEAETPEVEPATVHGVVVGDPALAAALRKAGFFSGKRIKAQHVEAVYELI